MPTFSDAEGAREAGNTLFKAEKYVEASASYNEALKILAVLQESAPALETTEADAPEVEQAALSPLQEAEHKCRLNRATCLIKLGGYPAARQEAQQVADADPNNAKAQLRLGQAHEAMGNLPAAQASLTECIKLAPSLKEPRQLLDSIRARTKANPRLEQAVQDMALVEERALRNFNYGDMPTSRREMELALRDARAHGQSHWECRALLCLALLCQEEGETEAAHDYLGAARRLLGSKPDRRAELFTLLATAMIELDSGKTKSAKTLLEGSIILADELCETGIKARLVPVPTPS